MTRFRHEFSRCQNGTVVKLHLYDMNDNAGDMDLNNDDMKLNIIDMNVPPGPGTRPAAMSNMFLGPLYPTFGVPSHLPSPGIHLGANTT